MANSAILFPRDQTDLPDLLATRNYLINLP